METGINRKGRLGRWFVRQRIRMDRGMFWLPTLDYLAGSVIGVVAGVKGNIYDGIFYGMSAYVVTRMVALVIGYIDETRWGLWQYNNKYMTEDLNPYFQELKRKVNE